MQWSAKDSVSDQFHWLAGRIRTSNQTVMSGEGSQENPENIDGVALSPVCSHSVAANVVGHELDDLGAGGVAGAGLAVAGHVDLLRSRDG